MPFSVILKAERLLVLSDVEFMKDMADHFLPIFSKETQATPEPSELELSLDEEDAGLTLVAPTLQTSGTDDVAVVTSDSPPVEDKLVAMAKSLPHVKVDVSMKDFRVALIEDVKTEDPQALTLKVRVTLVA